MAKWAFRPGGKHGMTTVVYVVDEHGCALNTEPVMIIESDWHPWFTEWLKQQPCAYPEGLGLLWHPALGESGPLASDKAG